MFPHQFVYLRENLPIGQKQKLDKITVKFYYPVRRGEVDGKKRKREWVTGMSRTYVSWLEWSPTRKEFIILMDACSPSTATYPLSLVVTQVTFTIFHQPYSGSHLLLGSWPLYPLCRLSACVGSTHQVAFKRARLRFQSCSVAICGAGGGGGGAATHPWPWARCTCWSRSPGCCAGETRPWLDPGETAPRCSGGCDLRETRMEGKYFLRSTESSTLVEFLFFWVIDWASTP